MATGFRELYNSAACENGKHTGAEGLAMMSGFQKCCVADYVWPDLEGNCRSKAVTLSNSPQQPDDAPIVLFNGVATGQSGAAGLGCSGDPVHLESDLYLVPRAVFKDPIRGGKNVIVVCEAINLIMEPARGNYRAMAQSVANQYAEQEFWVGMEQEYILMLRGKACGVSTGIAYASRTEGGPKKNGTYYCGVGCNNVADNQRDFMDDHYAACIAAGIKIAGTNCETTPGSGEFQIGPCKGVEIGDHVVAARHVACLFGEKYGFVVDFSPKPLATFDGSGLHTNVSSKETREKGGLEAIDGICRALGAAHKDHMQCYGDQDAQSNRLTGRHLTGNSTFFTYAVSSRNCSVRIPRQTAMTTMGHFEDRRPGGNADPYRVAGVIMQTAGKYLNPNAFLMGKQCGLVPPKA